ncbi:MAG: porphobilinogen synthase [Rickettsiales bacterium]|nr:porphobilinogen synthase [Rickettsiales bacterium]
MTNNFLFTRPRRNRQASWVRELVAETQILPSDLILPIFVIEGKNQKQEITALPDVYRYSIDLAVARVQEAWNLGIKAIMLFAVIDESKKDDIGSEALIRDNLTNRAIREIKNKVSEIGIIADVALDPYTSHGHDGIIKNGKIDNDATIDILCQQALIQAESGADANAPSDMMDGRIGKIREYLDQHDYQDNALISYAAKYSSHLYGPFRNAMNSLGRKEIADNIPKDKKSYQMDFRNINEAMREIELDVNEGADMAIIKPGSFYLDVIRSARDRFNIPFIAYQVSGEYAMLKFAASNGVFNFEDAFYESLVSFKRAGCSGVITYGAIELLNFL